MVRQLNRWFATFGVARSIICDNGPPFFSMAFKAFCDDYCINLQLTSTYNPKSLGAAERVVGLVKNIMKKNGEDRRGQEGMEEAAQRRPGQRTPPTNKRVEHER